MEKLLLTFKALSDRNRLRIVAALLQHGELCGCQLIELLGVAGGTASRHLSQLQTAGILTGRKEGRWNFFRVADDWRNTFPLEWLERRLESAPALARDREAMVNILAQRPVDICRRQRGGGSSPQRVEVRD